MNSYLPKHSLAICIFFAAFLGGCMPEESKNNVEIANPASEYCVKKGGKIEIVKEESGEKGMCHLPDGTIVEEWELFRRDNPQS